jgi:hypothetical protein
LLHVFAFFLSAILSAEAAPAKEEVTAAADAILRLMQSAGIQNLIPPAAKAYIIEFA